MIPLISLSTFGLLAPFALAFPSGGLVDSNAVFDSFVSRQAANSSNSTVCPTNNGLDPASFKTPLYTEPYRPQLHFSPSSGFMNDPNGLIKIGDTYHLYAQYNPFEMVAGNQHWLHATSKDLYTWKNHAWAIAPEGKGDGIFSGSTVIDFNNTSGFFNDTKPEERVVAIYTLYNGTNQHQSQEIAYSLDGGYNFTKYELNPVLISQESATQFRDPNVFWDEISASWIMTVSLPQKFKIQFYTSPDLKSWTLASEFARYGILGYQYECPSIVQVPIQGGPRDGERGWIMIISINPGARLGGSETQYIPGDWNGTHFTANDEATRFMNLVKDDYAGIPFHNTGNKTIFMSWMSNWQYSQVVPTSPWRSAQSIPKELSLKYIPYTPELSEYALVQEPVDVSPIRGDELKSSGDGKVTNGTTFDLTGNGAFDIQAEFTSNSSASNATAEVHIISSDGQGVLKLGILFGGPTVVYVDRRNAGHQWADENPFFTDRFSSQLTLSTLPDDNTTQVISFRAIVDRSITEVFSNGGEAVGSVTYFFDNDAIPKTAKFLFGNDQVQARNVTVHALKSTWPEC